MSTKTWIAFALDYREASCGCGYTVTAYVYEKNGNTIKRFKDQGEATAAARAKMLEYGFDNWNVI